MELKPLLRWFNTVRSPGFGMDTQLAARHERRAHIVGVRTTPGDLVALRLRYGDLVVIVCQS